MIRKSALLVAALALLVLVPSAHAAKGDWKISLLGGISVPTGDFSKKLADGGLGAKLGFAGGPSIDYMITDQVAIGADMHYLQNSLNSDERDLLRTIDPTIDLKYKQIGGAAHVKYWIPMNDTPMNVYLVGGAGFVNFKAEASAQGVSASVSENKFAAFGGVGLGANVTEKVSLGIQSDFTYVKWEGTSTPSFGVKGGVTFNIPTSGGGGY